MTTYVPLGELAAEKGFVGGPFGSNLVSHDYRPSGVPVIRGANMGEDGRLHGPFVYVSEEKFKSDLARNTASAGDLVFTQRGTLGQVARLDEGSHPFVISQSQMRLRVDPRKADSRYVLYACQLKEFRQLIDSVAIRTGVPHINLGILRELVIPVAPLPLQRAIAEVLGALDDKIAANRRVIDGGHKIAQFRVEVALGDADRCRVGDVAEFLNRKRVPLSKGEREARPGEVPYYGAAGRLDTVDDSLFDEPLVLVGEDGTVITDEGRAVVQYIWGPSWVNNHAHVLRGTTVSTCLLRWLVYRAEVRHLVTGAVQPKISMGNLKTLELAVPGKDVRGALEDECDMFAAQERALSEENETLAKTRDELLPLLMSGKITVRDAEKRVEGVV